MLNLNLKLGKVPHLWKTSSVVTEPNKQNPENLLPMTSGSYIPPNEDPGTAGPYPTETTAELVHGPSLCWGAL